MGGKAGPGSLNREAGVDGHASGDETCGDEHLIGQHGAVHVALHEGRESDAADERERLEHAAHVLGDRADEQAAQRVAHHGDDRVVGAALEDLVHVGEGIGGGRLGHGRLDDGRPDGRQHEEQAALFDADSIITASQIDTSVELSRRTLDALLDGNLDVQLSQVAVSLEFGLSASCSTVDESQQQAAASLQLLSEASGLESDSESPGRPAATTGPTFRPQIKTDVNFVAGDESMDLEINGDSEETGLVAARDDNPNPAETQGEAGVSDASDPSCRRSAHGAHAVPTEAPLLRALDDGRGWRFPAGTFGRFMARNRCTDIIRDLHIVNNEAPRTRDKLWKLRPVVDKLQQQFLAGWSLPAVFSFDEAVLPATSSRNTTRMFMPDEPHCFEIYAGKRRSGDDDTKFDHKTGAIAVVRNLNIILGPDRLPWHAVVIDRYYSSVLLAIELLKMQVYVIGTVMTNRLGYDAMVKNKRQVRPASIPRGTFTFSRSVAVPTMVAFHWWDRKPVHYLCTGAVMAESSIGRNVKQVGAVTVPCPAPVTDYQRWMGGVDVHDQLRLQSYSLQTSTKFTKHYKSLFLGMVDLALVNAFISHKEAAKMAGTTPMKRAESYAVLQNQLLQMEADDFAGVPLPPVKSEGALLFVSPTHWSSRRTG
ncbi:hypothetical protein ON010_g14661 [Phytophthora cinnamomi]|nr:hypothetical protein ON010_g14661 [Phytophthora cinnamomi]